MGCVMQVGAQGVNIGRNAVLAAGFPEAVPATTIDRQCGSSQQAAHFAAQGVIAGAYDVVIAAGVEVMTQVPMGASFADGKYGMPFGPKVGLRYAEVGGLVPQGISAELIADKWGLSREDLDAFGAESQQRAARATDEGRFEQRDHPGQGEPPRPGDRQGRRVRRAGRPPTRASAATPPPRRWPTSSRPSSPTARSPPATARRSPTAPRPPSS